MAKPDSRRLSKPLMPWQEAPAPTAPPSAPKPKPKTVRLPVKKTRSDSGDEGEEEEGPSPAVLAAQSQEESRNKLMLYGGIAAGVFLLLVIVVAASGSSGHARAEERRPKPKPVVVEAYTPPPPPPRAMNEVRTTGCIVFVCANSGKHEDKEVLLHDCPTCPGRNQFEVSQEAGGYLCVKCKKVLSYADLKCEGCGRTPRVSHLKHAPPSMRP